MDVAHSYFVYLSSLTTSAFVSDSFFLFLPGLPPALAGATVSLTTDSILLVFIVIALESLFSAAIAVTLSGLDG
jgi:hypothetical protein